MNTIEILLKTGEVKIYENVDYVSYGSSSEQLSFTIDGTWKHLDIKNIKDFTIRS
jgi:hypothetical protein